MNARPTLSPAEAYEEYYRPAIFGPLSSILLGHAAPRPGEDLLDVACGTGVVTRGAATIVGKAAQIVGVDLHPGMLEVARTVAPTIDSGIVWMQGDGAALDLPDHSFDLVLCQQGLQFFPDRAAGAREMRRVARDTGRAALAVWQGLDRHPLFAALAEAELPELTRFGVSVTHGDLVAPFSCGDPDVLRDLLREAGFQEVDVTQVSMVARFSAPDRFVERLEFAYAAVVPAFAEDASAFADYLAAVTDRTRDAVEAYREDDYVVVPMHTNVALAYA
jgi:ubiquinone/menaquinone biosynthesis C-methylase UbiE